MNALSVFAEEPELAEESALIPELDSAPTCFSLTVFTQRWKEIRDFYVDILGATVESEQPGQFTEMTIGGLPICLRHSQYGETVSYFHFHICLKNRAPVLRELQKRGIIVTRVGPYYNFRDPEGRVIKLSEDRTSLN
jgi:catechol 2,3-dioxygenase-like lactoylglutathione lyase family enzyme